MGGGSGIGRRATLVALALVLVLPGAAAAQLPELPPLPGLPPGVEPPSEEPPPSGQPPAEGEGGKPGDVVSYRMNPQHTGATPDVSIFGPLYRVWTKRFGGAPSQPLIVSGRVIANVSDGFHDNSRSRVVAFDPRTGRRIWSRATPGTYFTAHLAIDAGRVVAVNRDGVAHAFAVRDGRPAWTFTAPGVAPSAHGAPVAAGGTLYYAVSHGQAYQATVHAVSTASGSLRWSRSVPISDFDGMPALDARRVFVTDECGNAVALRRSDGSVAWSRSRDSECSRGAAGLLLEDRLFTTGDDGSTYDAVTGANRGALPGTAPDAAAGDTGYAYEGRRIRATALATGAVRWRRRMPLGSNPALRPILAGPTVFTGTGTRRLIGRDRMTGELLSVARLPYESHSAIGGIEPGMAAGHGLVVATGGLRLTALAPILRPAARGTDTAASRYDLKSGKLTHLVGGLGRALSPRRGREVVLQSDAYPYRGYRRQGRERTLGDGTAYFHARPGRNTRFRVRLDGRSARSTTVYAYPWASHRVRAVGRHHVRVRVSMKADAGFRAGGRDLVTYWWRRGSKRFFRVGEGEIDQTGRGRARAEVVFRRPARAGRRDRIFWCIEGLRGYGRPNPLYRRCGAREVRF